MPRADGPVIPSPRAGMAMVRESSSHTTARARIDMPPPPYSVGTSSCQMPSSLARLEALEILRLDLFAVGGLALDRDHLIVDEAPQRGFEDSQLFRQFEIHCLHAPSASSRHNTRTSTATAPASAPVGFDALDCRSRAGLLARTISGLISMSFILARWSRKKRASASAAASNAARSAAGCPRKPERRLANFRPSTIVLTSRAVAGSRRNAASATSSTSTPPEPTSSSGP